ncbi:MAG: hypothetical protein KF887_18770 [Paracoccaceae bacterium]|nr:MAG: hypothetical protein KF887_18770 [Paracoccaceae bacterium]
MRPIVIARLSVLLALAACATPQEACIARETRDLRVLDRLIAETEGNLARGYAIEEYTVDITVMGTCLEGGGKDETGATLPPIAVSCFQDREVTRTRPKAIDLNAERQKLSSMQAKRAERARAAAPAVASCRAQYPE